MHRFYRWKLDWFLTGLGRSWFNASTKKPFLPRMPVAKVGSFNHKTHAPRVFLQGAMQQFVAKEFPVFQRKYITTDPIPFPYLWNIPGLHPTWTLKAGPVALEYVFLHGTPWSRLSQKRQDLDYQTDWNALTLTVCRRENTQFQKPLSNGTPVPKLLNLIIHRAHGTVASTDVSGLTKPLEQIPMWTPLLKTTPARISCAVCFNSYWNSINTQQSSDSLHPRHCPQKNKKQGCLWRSWSRATSRWSMVWVHWIEEPPRTWGQKRVPWYPWALARQVNWQISLTDGYNESEHLCDVIHHHAWCRGE